MKRFAEIMPILRDASRELPATDAPCAPEDVPSWVAAIPFQDICSADDACRRFAATLSWPDAPADVRAQIHLRLDQAQQFAMTLPDQPIPKEDGQETLEFLLIELWHASGIQWVAEVFGPPHG